MLELRLLADRWVVVPALGSFTASVLLHGSMCTVLSAEWGMRLVTGLASHFLGTFVAMPTASLEVEWANGNGVGGILIFTLIVAGTHNHINVNKAELSPEALLVLLTRCTPGRTHLPLVQLREGLKGVLGCAPKTGPRESGNFHQRVICYCCTVVGASPAGRTTESGFFAPLDRVV